MLALLCGIAVGLGMDKPFLFMEYTRSIIRSIYVSDINSIRRNSQFAVCCLSENCGDGGDTNLRILLCRGCQQYKPMYGNSKKTKKTTNII